MATTTTHNAGDGLPCRRAGKVVAQRRLRLTLGKREILNLDAASLAAAFKETLGHD